MRHTATPPSHGKQCDRQPCRPRMCLTYACPREGRGGREFLAAHSTGWVQPGPHLCPTRSTAAPPYDAPPECWPVSRHTMLRHQHTPRDEFGTIDSCDISHAPTECNLQVPKRTHHFTCDNYNTCSALWIARCQPRGRATVGQWPMSACIRIRCRSAVKAQTGIDMLSLELTCMRARRYCTWTATQGSQTNDAPYPPPCHHPPRLVLACESAGHHAHSSNGASAPCLLASLLAIMLTPRTGYWFLACLRLHPPLRFRL